MYRRVSAERPWAELIGYSRAVRLGPLIEVGGTTATAKDGEVLYPGDAYQQTKYSLEVMIESVKELGGTVHDIVRTRAFLTNIDDWEAVGRAHGELFKELDPASTFLEVSRLLLPGLVVELEATAFIVTEETH